jgi:hypothetical protein
LSVRTHSTVNAMTGVEPDGSSEKAEHGAALLVGEDFGVGQARAVVDGDVHAFPACGLAVDAEGVLASWPQAPGGISGEPGASAVLDPSEMLDVDMDQFTWPFALIAHGWLHAETAELAHPDPRQDARHGRERHVEDPRDLWAGEPHPPQGGDRLHALRAGPVRDPTRSRGPVAQPELALGAVATDPFARAADADAGGLRRLRHRPLALNDSPAELPTAFQTERRVSVQIHIRCPPWWD